MVVNLILRRYEFQSAPHFSSEANIPISIRCNRNNLFQSAPHFSSEANVAFQV